MFSSGNSLRERLGAFLSDRETRAWLHAAILLLGAAILLAAELQWNLFQAAPPARDKALHYHVGRVIATVAFYLVYFGVVARVLLVGRDRGSSLTVALLWTPALIAAALLAAIGVAFAAGLAKEVLDMGGAGHVEWLDVDATLDGAATIVYPVALIMAVTPVLIPFDVLLQIPNLMLADVRTGVKTVDSYVRERKFHEQYHEPADVLLVEDDIFCATTVMHFCRTVGLTCHHVWTILEADEYLRDNLLTVRLVLLDNFVRVDRLGNNTTGIEWLEQVNPEFPRGKRGFLVVLVSGHAELLASASSLADLVLQKPWSPRFLASFLTENGVLPA